jgi:hypothetical protein
LKHYKEILKNVGDAKNGNQVIKEEEKHNSSFKNGGGSVIGK